MRYRSPEAHVFQSQHAARQDARYTATEADDLYALGVVLYWMLTDTYPLAAVDTHTELEVVRARMPGAPHEVNPRVPRPLSALCMHLLARGPEERPASALAVCTAVEALLATADAPWDVPLCEAHGEQAPAAAASAPLDESREEEEWVRNGPLEPGPPRRGRRPAPPARLPVAAVARRAEPGSTVVRQGPGPGTPPRFQGRARRLAAAGVALVLAGLAGATAGLWPEAPPGGEMAPSAPRVEAGPATVPPVPAPPPVSAALCAAPPSHEETPVMTPETPPAEKPGSTGRKLTGAALTAMSLCLGCPSGPQVREPPKLPCPEGAAAAMKELGISTGQQGAVTFLLTMEDAEYVTVREGEATVRSYRDIESGPWMKILTMSGNLYLGDRVYGFFTEARLASGATIPVCLELRDREGERGLRREPGEPAPGSARTWSEAQLRAVERFQ